MATPHWAYRDSQRACLREACSTGKKAAEKTSVIELKDFPMPQNKQDSQPQQNKTSSGTNGGSKDPKKASMEMANRSAPSQSSVDRERTISTEREQQPSSIARRPRLSQSVGAMP